MLLTGQAAKRLGISIRTLYRWEAAGRLHAMARLPSGQRRFAAREVDALLRARTGATEQCAVYARVSSEKQAEAGNLERQRERLVEAAIAKGYGVAAVAERASGLNEKRRGLQRLFRLAAAGEIDVVLIERIAWRASASPIWSRRCRHMGSGSRSWMVRWRWTQPRSWWPTCWPS